MHISFNQEAALARQKEYGLAVPSHQLTVNFRIVRPVEHEVLERAFMALIARHAILRTSFAIEPTPIATVHARVEWHLADRSVDGEDRVPDAIARLAAQPLDTGTAPLMRATVLRAGQSAQFLLISISHLIVDATAIRLLVRELAAAYMQLIEHGRTEWVEGACQYHEFAAWQRTQFQSGRFAGDEVFWLKQWLNVDGAAIRHRDLPWVRPGTHDERDPVAARLETRVASTDAARIRAAVKRLELTPYMLFRAAATLVLHRSMNKPRLAIWANFANRRRLSFKRLIGWCANTHIVVTDADPQATCGAFCARVAHALYAAQTHEALPLHALWHRLGRTFNVHRTRVNFDGARARPLAAADTLFEHTAVAAGVPLMDLDIRLREEPEGYNLLATFTANCYETAGIERMLGSVCRVATKLADDPDARVSSCDHLIAV